MDSPSSQLPDIASELQQPIGGRYGAAFWFDWVLTSLGVCSNEPSAVCASCLDSARFR